MTKYELNKRLAELLGIFGGKVGDHMPDGVKACHDKYGIPMHIEADYCNNWNHLMPLVVGHGITNLHLGDNEWEVSFDFKGDMEINGTDEILSHAIECNTDKLAETIVKCLIAKLEGEQ
tara:strand:- start:187 stop:543 length:357 start_codon:yes stop_codon:yes gene_type:complete